MAAATDSAGRLAVVVCTRNRPRQVQEALDALARQTVAGIPVLVVDQSDDRDAALADRAAREPSVTALRDEGRGLSRARNVAWRSTAADWLAFVDDDCLPEPDFLERLLEVIEERPEVEFISGNVGGRSSGERPDDLPFSTFPVDQEREISGPWVHPSAIGFGVCMAVRRTAIDRLGGWDERLGPGVPDFPAADDMDFNHRFLRGGGVAFVTPRVRAWHDQWRDRTEVVELYEGYTRAWCGLAAKTLRRGAPLAGAWLWWVGGPRFAGRMLASALRRRSRFRARVAAAGLRGLAAGTALGLRRRW